MPDTLPPEAESLFQQSMAGDDDAWGRLIAAYRDRMRRFVERALPAAVRARESESDIIQQTMFAAFQTRGRFKGDRAEAVAPWLFGILKNRLRDVLRRHGHAGRRAVAREVSLSMVGTSEIPAAHPSSTLDHSGRDHVNAILANLPEADRQLLRWRLEDDLPFTEIGSRLGISEDAARVRHSRLMAELRRRVKERGGGSDSAAPSAAN